MDLKQNKLSHSLLMETKKHTTRVKKNKDIMFLRIKKILENQLLGFESKTGCFQKQPPEVLYIKSCSKRFCNIQRKTPVLESLFSKFNFIKSGIFRYVSFYYIRCFPAKFLYLFWGTSANGCFWCFLGKFPDFGCILNFSYNFSKDISFPTFGATKI